MIKIYKGEDFNSLINSRILVDFYAEWCGPCKMLGPVLEKIDGIDILKVNVDDYSDIAKEYKVMSIPCVVLFDKGSEVKRNIGFMNEDKIKEFIK